MNEVQIFKSEEFGQVRTIEKNGEPWFIGKDVAEILGYERAAKAIQDHVDLEDKDGIPIQDSIGRMQKTSIINESGLYSLILSSKLPTAKKFKHWVTGEILPTIRRHGAYMTENTLEKALTNPDFLIKLANELKSEQEKRKVLETKIEEDKPKVLFAEAVSVADTSILIGELAKILKQNGVETGQNRLFQFLRNEGFLIKRKGNDYNMPTQKAMEMGLFEIKETVISHADGHTTINKTPKVTGKGQQYFINYFLNKKYLEKPND